MNVNFFDREAYAYALPEELIAQYPLKERDEARLLIVDRQAQAITHDIFKNVGTYLPPKSCLVINDTKVIPARLFGVKESTGAKVEIFILKQVDEDTWEVLMRPMKRLRDGERVVIEGTEVVAEIVDKDKRLVRFNTASPNGLRGTVGHKNILAFLAKNGHIPLPPYVKREDDLNDRTDYQTVYAEHFGSVAAPTAGLHFTKNLMTALDQAGHDFFKVTLHINYGTFKPVETPDIRQHPMHQEFYEIGVDVMKKIEASKKSGRPIIAVGTTASRTLESFAKTENLSGDTDLFIYPGYEFQLVDGLITNFHLPYSTLLMLVSAFGGYELIRRAYQEAIAKKYRFYSYGDAMLIV